MSEELKYKQLNVRIPLTLYQKLEDYCEKNNTTFSDVVRRLLENLLLDRSRKDDLKEVTWSKPLPVKWPHKKCVSCGRELQVGELALIAKDETGRWMYLCYECYIKTNVKYASTEAKQLLRVYRDYLKIKALRDRAKKELNEIATKLNVTETVFEINNFLSRLDEFLVQLEDYLRSVESNADLKAIYNELSKIYNELAKITEYIEILASKKMKIKTKKEVLLNE